MHGWRSFMFYKEGQPIRHEVAERLLGDLSGRPDGGLVLGQLKELCSPGVLPWSDLLADPISRKKCPAP